MENTIRLFRNKKSIICLLIIILGVTGCKGKSKEIPERQNKNNLDYVREFAKEINKNITTKDDTNELKMYLDSIKENIGEQTYLSNFDLSNSVLAVKYNLDYSVEDYLEKEIIVIEKETETEIYIAFSATAQLYEDITEDTDGDEFEFIGLNRYNFVEGKLVNFKRILY